MQQEKKEADESQQQPSLVPTWYWKETRNHLVSENLPLWKKFEPHLNKLIESAFASQEPSLITRDLTIDFQLLIMTRRSSETVINFPVSRKTEEEEKPQIPQIETEEFKEGLKYSPLILGEWFKRNIPKMYNLTYAEKIRYAYEAACRGILVKAQQLGEKAKEGGDRLIKEFKENIDENDPEKILEASARIYTFESFLYREANSFLRNYMIEDVDILGPFCFLLNEHIWLTEIKRIENSMKDKTKVFRGILYRGVSLSIEDLFKSFPLEDKLLRLSSFTSTFPEKKIALAYSSQAAKLAKLLIEIEVPKETGLFCSELVDLSMYPAEKEVLLPPGSMILVKERFTDDKDVHIIKGTLLSNKQASYNLTTLKQYLERPQHQTNKVRLSNHNPSPQKSSNWWQPIKNWFKKSGAQGVIWYWKANQDPWSVRDLEIWKEYTKDEIQLIEMAYKIGQNQVQVGNYQINFGDMIQVNSLNSRSIRPVKRTDRGHERKRQLLLYESIGKYLSPLVVAWQAEFMLEYGAPILKHVGVLTDLIDLGIIEEAKTQNQELMGRAMTTKLKEVAYKSNFDIEKVFKCLVRMYTEETFLYKIINKALRENDLTKADTLGAFCLLFNELITYFDTIKKYPYSGIVWRGTSIDESILNTYYPDKEPFIYWPAFSSTSKDKAAAERFMANVLFEIRLYDKGVDVGKLSAIQHEREVLIHSGSVFKVIDHKMITQKVHHIILSSQAF